MQIRGKGIRTPDATLTVFHDGTAVRTPPGVSVAAALTNAGILACRSTAAGDRGVFCGMGVCAECTVAIDDRPGQLACMTIVHDGMRIERQPVRPRPDVTAPAPEAIPEQVVSPELLVVGGGPAGLAAAATAAEAGVDVLLVDERAKLGGQYYKQPATTFEVDPHRLDHQYTRGRALIERVQAAGVRVLGGARIWGADGARELYASDGTSRWVIRPGRLVLATGAYERVVPFPGWTLPGVMTTGAGQSLARAYQVAPGRRVLVAGNGPLNVQLAAELSRAGGDVAALVELARVTSPAHAADLARMAAASPQLVREGLGYLATLRRAKVPMLTGRAVVRVEGTERAEHAVVARLDAEGRPVPGTEQGFDVDAVCVGLGFMPGNEVARLIGAHHTVDPATGGYVVTRTDRGRTSLDGVWVVGDGAEVRGAKVAENAGVLVGADVAASLDRPADGLTGLARARRDRRRHERFQRALWRVYRGPALFAQLAEPDTVVCRCESVPLETIDTAVDTADSAGAVKRLTRGGMGRCQGRFCGFVIADRVAGRTGTAVDGFAGFAPQPPMRPTPISVLAAPEPDDQGGS
jgi:NADPH-dependent 2,4-dienoyl-CoA reductase/sulfur reductase-like enzyme